MKIFKTLKGGSLSSTNVVIDGNAKFVRKSISRTLEREFGLVRWQSQIRKLQQLQKYIPESTIHINRIGVKNNFYYYDIPYFENYINCYEALINGESPELIAEKTSILLCKMAAINYECHQGSLSLYVAEEILSPLIMAKEMANNNNLNLTNEESVKFKKSINEGIKIVEKLKIKTQKVTLHESLSHGNLTLENILWDPSLKELIIIDPYGETYCESIMGDVSQLLQSSASGYEYVSQLLEKNSYQITDYPINTIPECLSIYSRLLTDKISHNKWYSEEYLTIFRASQFTRMFPFKIHISPRVAVAFMLHGLNLLEESLDA